MMTKRSSATNRVGLGPALPTGGLNFKRLVLIACVGALSGLAIPSFGPLRQPVLVLAFLGLTAHLFLATVRRQVAQAWATTAFFVALEPAFRAHAQVLPYLALDYVLLFTGAISFVMSRPGSRARTLPAIAYGVYIVLEIAGSVSAETFNLARGIVLPSMLMFMFLLNGARARLSASATSLVLASYVAGALTLTGFALRSYLAGNITWNTESNFDAAGGMPPNHISVLLSVAVFACVVLCEDATKLQRILLVGAATVLGSLMVLTFSRGGTVLVVGSLFLYYVFLRPTSRRTIVILIAVAVIGLAVSYGTDQITGGKIADRYGETNTSNRFTIVVQGWGLYVDHPVLGVGTSNFREAIQETDFGRVTGAHNELIRAAAEHGTLGLAAWLCFIGSAFLCALRKGEAHRARRGLRAVICVFAATSMFYNGLKLTVQPMLILLALSAFTAIDAAPKPGPQPKRPRLT